MATSVTSTNAIGQAAPASPGLTSPATNALGGKDTFLKLLVAQIKNQNPLNPADSMQFVTQLAQFSELEQMIGMHDELSQLRQDLQPQPSTGEQQENGGISGT